VFVSRFSAIRFIGDLAALAYDRAVRFRVG